MTTHQLFDFICDKHVEFKREGDIYIMQVITHPGTDQPHSHVALKITEEIKSGNDLITLYVMPACLALDRAIKQISI